MKVLRPYIERIPSSHCPICTKRKTGGKWIQNMKIKICDVCHDKYYARTRREMNTLDTYIEFLHYLCTASERVIDVSNDRLGGETIENIVLDSTDFNMTLLEVVCDLSSTGLFVRETNSRWVFCNFNLYKILLIDLNNQIGFIFDKGMISKHELLRQERMIESPDFIYLTPKPSFAHGVEPSVLAANTL